MSNRISIPKISEANGTTGRRSPGKSILVLALGFFVMGQPARVNAWNPVQAPKSIPTASAAPTTPTAPPPDSTSGEYLITPGDVLDVYIYDVPELSHTYAVGHAGSVTLPLLPTPVQAAGLTADQVARAIEEAFRQAGRLKRPVVAVSVAKQSHTSSVAVEGAVRNPQILSGVGQSRLIDIITLCGGLADDAGTAVTVTRGSLALRETGAEGGPASPTLTVELRKAMDITDPASAIVVWPGDRVSVGKAGVYYVLGEVRTPGGYTLKNARDQLTVLRALALAGDATNVARTSKAMIIRRDPKAAIGREEIRLDLKKILNGKSPDPVLQADDILFVPGSNGKKALRTIENAPGAIIGDAGAAALIVH